jgi:hypothetical protein
MKINLPELALASNQNHTRNEATFIRKPVVIGSSFRRFAAERFDQLVALKERIAANLEKEFAGTIGAPLIRQIVTEAEALAATTPFPALLLPALAEEKAHNAAKWSVRQQTIRNQTFTLAA